MEEGLFYSEEALLNRVLFLSEYNEVNIFVEDEYKEYEYENIFERMFADELKINDIFPMKGKPGVKKAFEQYGACYEGKPSVYIVDGDFDIIMEKDMVCHPNFIYLDKYNIESYYVDEIATMKYMAGKLKKRRKDIVEHIDYDNWLNCTYSSLKELFINYIIAQREFPDEKNVGVSPHVYISDITGYIDNGRIQCYVERLKDRVINYEQLYDFYEKRFLETLDGDATRLICGKYIIASLSQYLRKRTNVKFKEEDFKYFLVSEFDVGKLSYVRERIMCLLHPSD